MAVKHQSIAFYALLAISIVATIIYGYYGYKDTKSIVENIYQEQQLLTRHIVERSSLSDKSSQLLVFASLESDTMVARNKRSSSALATRTWLRYSLTIVGLILSIYGSAFVLGQITIAEPSQFTGGAGNVSVNITTTSPGLILAALGVAVIIIPAVVPQDIKTTDAATYWNFSPLASGASNATSPPQLSREEAQQRLGIKDTTTEGSNHENSALP